MLVMVSLTIAKRRVRNEIKGQWMKNTSEVKQQLTSWKPPEGSLGGAISGSKVQSQELIVLHATEN